MAGWVPDQNSPPGFLTGFLGVVGPKLQEKHDQALKLQSQKKDAEFGTYWNSMQAAATRLSQLKQKGDLTPEELQEAQRLAGQYSWSEQQLNKMTKGDKPLGETFQKVGGFVKHLLSRPSPKGKLQPPGQQQPQPSAAQAVDGSQAQVTGQYPSKPLQPPAPIQQQPSMQGAMALAASQSPEAQKERIAEAGPKRREQWIKDNATDTKGWSAKDKAEYIEKGNFPPEKTVKPTALDLLRQARAIVDDPDAAESDKQAAQDFIDTHKKVEKKVSLQAGWAKYPDDPAGAQPHAIRIDPQNPGRVLDANTGNPVPEGTQQVNPSVITGQMRQDSYGSFGNYYRAARGRGMNEEEARESAAQKVDQEFNVKLSRQEQQIGIDAALSGIGGVPPREGPSKPSTAPGAPSPSQPPTPASAPTPTRGATPAPSPAQSPGSDQDRENITYYLSSVLGVQPKAGGKAAGVRSLKGQEALAKLTGLSPMQLNAELVGDKATAKALMQAMEVSGAFGRVQETLKAHGQVLLDAAKAYGPGNTPIVNKTYQWLQDNLTAHPELTKYSLALNAVQREYARMVSGGVQSRAMLPVTTVEKGEAVLRRESTLADILAAVQQLKIEADTEQKAFGNQIEGLKDKLKTGAIGTATNTPSPNGRQNPPAAKVKVWDPATGSFKEQ